MAKAIRPSPEKLSAMNDLLEELVRKLEDRMFSLEGIPKATVKYADGSFKVKPLVAGWEYFLAYGYVGARGIPIFGFNPEDTQEYESVEFDLNQLDDYLPLFGPAIGESLGVDEERAAKAFNKALDKRLLMLSVEKEHAESKLTAIPNFGRFA